MRHFYLMLFVSLFFYCSGCKKTATVNNIPTSDTNGTLHPAANKPVELQPYPYVDTFVGRLSAKLDFDGGGLRFDNDSAYIFYVKHKSKSELAFLSSRVILEGEEYPREMNSVFTIDSLNIYGPVDEQFRMVADSLYVKWSDFYHHKGGQATGGFVFGDGSFSGKLLYHSPR